MRAKSSSVAKVTTEGVGGLSASIVGTYISRLGVEGLLLAKGMDAAACAAEVGCDIRPIPPRDLLRDRSSVAKREASSRSSEYSSSSSLLAMVEGARLEEKRADFLFGLGLQPVSLVNDSRAQ